MFEIDPPSDPSIVMISPLISTEMALLKRN